MAVPTLVIFSLITGVTYLVNPATWVVIVGGVLSIGLTYCLYYSEEKSGKMGYEIGKELFKLLFSEKMVDLHWEGTENYERHRSLTIRRSKNQTVGG